MTPTLTAVYDELLVRGARPPHAERAFSLRDGFLRRTASSGRLDDEPEDRVRAAWDDALTTGGLAAALAPSFEDPSERALVRVLSRAHRGLFRMSEVGRHRIAVDLVSGASFVLLARDDIAREVLGSREGEDAPLFEARIVAASDGCAMMPGILFHPAAATEPILELVRAAELRGLSKGTLCDALLRMMHAFRSLARVKIGYAYRLEALDAPAPSAAAAGAPG